MAWSCWCIALLEINCQELCYVLFSLKDPVTGSRTLGPSLHSFDNRYARKMAKEAAITKSLHYTCCWVADSLWVFAYLANRADAAGEPLSYPHI